MAQTNKVDSLLALVNTSKKDTSAVMVYSNLCWAYLNQSEHKKALDYGEKGLKLAKEINFKFGTLKCYKNLGSVYTLMADFDKALLYYNSSLKIAEEINDKNEIANCNGNIGNIFYYKSDYVQALLFYEKQLKLVEETKNSAGMARCYNNIGSLYAFLGNYPKALGYYLRKLQLSEELKDDDLKAGAYTNMGILYVQLQRDDKAEEYYSKALKIYEKLGDRRSCAMIYVNFGNLNNDRQNYSKAREFHERSLNIATVINDKELISKNLEDLGLIYLIDGDKNKAMDHFLKTLAIKREIEDLYGIAACYVNIGSIQVSEGKNLEGLEYLAKALEIGQKIGSPDILRSAYTKLAESNFKIENFKQAYIYQVKLKEVNDSVFNVENSKILSDIKTNFEVERIETELKTKAAAQQAIAEEKNRKQKVISISVAIGLVLVLILALFIYRSNRQKQKANQLITQQKQEVEIQKHVIEEKHKEITDSINYAERIQRSFLASKDLLDDNLKEYFVLFMPKDVVSGDFYWATILNHNFALVTADSTGHGVPGAIMSLLNITSLESAIKDGYMQPADILNATRKTIIERLKKDGSVEGGKDGMDCCLTVYDFKNKKLSIAAANNPVWIVRGAGVSTSLNDREVLEIRPDKMPVGKHDRDSVSFTQQEIDLQSGDVVYTLTDGFPDQFGGENGKKFMSKNLRELLAANAHLPMHEQKELLVTTFKNWVGDMEQVDDVTIIGVRV